MVIGHPTRDDEGRSRDRYRKVPVRKGDDVVRRKRSVMLSLEVCR